MFKGVLTLQAYEQCLKRGLCERHIKELNQNERAVREAELPRKAFLFIRVNLLYALLFKKSTKCEKVKILLQRTPVFSRVLAKGDASEAVDAILVLDSVVVFTLCQLSKVCCIGALFQKDSVNSEDPEIKQLQNLLFVDRIEGAILHHLYPLLQKNFVGFDLDVIKVSYVLTLLFVRNYCVKLDIKTAPEIIEEEFKGVSRWENFKNMGDVSYQIGNYKDASNAYTSAMMLNSYSSELFTQRAQTFLKLGKFKAAQLDAYVAVIIDPKCCEGYYVFASSLFHQKLYQDAFEFAIYGLAVGELNESFYESLQALSIEIEMNYLNKGVDNISENSVNHSDTTEKPVPEQKYFPVLVDSDSADSESEIVSKKDVPELVDTSDSDENETVEKKTVNTQTKNKTKKKRIPSEDTTSVMCTQMEMIKTRTFLKEASEAVLSDCGYKAVQIFRGPLRDFIDSSKLNTFEECEVVCVKYAYGIAYCKSGEYDDLLKCITILKEIIEKHDSITFPAAYYALGFTYRKLNRFKEALNYLETVKNFLSKGIHFKVYPWPEITTVIQETKPEILKVLVDDLIKECENPPNPDALCRFADCCFQPTIYYTDPDFKGYISLLCSEQCCLQYHLQCWKTIKTEKKLTDKEFLEQICFTPDCEGVIIKVQNIDKKGDLAKEFTSDFKKNTKQKWAKWEKKADIKEKKKKRVNSRSDDSSQEVSSESGKVSSRKNSDANERTTIIHSSSSVIPSVEKDASSVEKYTSSENVQKILQKVKESELDGATKENNICSSSVNDVQEIQNVPCVSDEYNSAQEIPDINSVSEKENEYNVAQEIPDINSVSEKENECSHVQNMPNPTSGVQNETEFNNYMQENTSQYLVSQCIKNNVYSYMSDFLQHHGPLRTDDKLLTDEMASFPDEVNIMIAECGGIGEFLKNDLRFAFVGDIYICVVSDLAAAYKMNISSSLPTDLESLESLESAGHSKYYDGCSIDSQKQNFGLNPDALEYTPAVKSVGRKDTKKINTNNSFPKTLNVSNFALDPESLNLSSDNTNAISNSQMSKSKSCDTVSDSKFCDNSKSIFSDFAHSEKIGICDKENCKGLSNEHVYISELSSKSANSDSDINAVNCNQNMEEINRNLCTDFANLSLLSVNKEIQNNDNSTENSKIKKIQTQLLPVLKEICSEGFNNYRQYIDACVKPYSVRKLPETATTGTETDFEIVSAECLRFLEDTLKTVKKQLTEQILSLKNQLSSTVNEKNELSEEVSKLKTSLSTSSFDLEVQKIDYRKKEEDLINGRQYILKSLADARSSIDEQKKRIELLETMNSRLQATVDNLTSSLNEAEVEVKTALEAEEKKHSDITRSLRKENDELKCQVKYAEVKFLQTKKSEYLNRIEDKYLDASTKKQEFTQGLSMISGNLNPVVHSSMKTIFAQLSSYINELNAHKLEFVKQIDGLIEKVEKGASLKELKEIEMKKLPDPPCLQSLFPQLDKYLLNSTQMACNLLNIGSLPQVPSAAVMPPATASTASSIKIISPANPSAAVIKPPTRATTIPQANSSTAVTKPPTHAAVIPQANPSAAVIKPPTHAMVIPQANPSAAIIKPPTRTTVPQAKPSATIIPQATPSATIIPQATPSATIIPQATPSTIIPPTSVAAVIPPVTHSVLSSIMPILEANKSKQINNEAFDILNPQIQESFKTTGASINSFSSIPYSVPTLDKEFNKTCAIFRPPEPVSNNKLDTPKVPPGIINCAPTSVSSNTTSSSSKDSLETFPSVEKTLGSLNAASNVNEPVLNSLEQEKKKATAGNRISSSYDKLLVKLKEQFPSYSQDELIDFVKEFRAHRRGKLTGMAMDAIIGELSIMIKSKKNSEKKFHEPKVQPKSNKVLVNKKLVPDTKTPAVTEQQSVKKKSAWGTIDSDHKRIFASNADDDCTICCDPMTNTSAYKVACGHTFHEDCIRQWLKNKSNCPVCRVLLLLPDEYPSLS